MTDAEARAKLNDALGTQEAAVAKAAAEQLKRELQDLEERAARRTAEILLARFYAQQASLFPTSSQVQAYITEVINPRLGISPPQT